MGEVNESSGNATITTEAQTEKDQMNDDMRSAWYPLFLSSEVHQNSRKPLKQHLLGDPIIFFRDSDGKVVCLADKCPHRSAPLSLGTVNNGVVECKYHGWEFDSFGQCTNIPALLSGKRNPKGAHVDVYPCQERFGYVWVWPQPNSSPDVDLIPWETDKFESKHDTIPTGWTHYDCTLDLDVDHSLVLENFLDPAHVPFTHTGTFGSRSDATGLGMEIKQKGGKILGYSREDSLARKRGSLDVDFEFEPPCCVRIKTVFGPGKWMHQINYIVPTRPGELRVLLRNYYDVTWLRYIPFVSHFHRQFETRVVLEDYELLHGQTSNLNLGAKAWNQAIQADSLAVHYRKWLRRAMKKKPWFKGFSDDIEDLELCNKKRVASKAQEYGFGLSDDNGLVSRRSDYLGKASFILSIVALYLLSKSK